jgi:hypothetical protein
MTDVFDAFSPGALALALDHGARVPLQALFSVVSFSCALWTV